MLLALVLGAERYLVPVQGALVHASELYSGPGSNYESVSDKPLAAGTVVEIIGVDEDSGWIKVVGQGNVFGYVRGEALRLVQ